MDHSGHAQLRYEHSHRRGEALPRGTANDPPGKGYRSGHTELLSGARMTIRIYNLGDLGPQAQQMAKHCDNERLAMTLQCVAIGSMIVMATATAAQLVKDL